LLALRNFRLREKVGVGDAWAASYQAEFQPSLIYLAKLSDFFNSQYTPADIGAMSPFVAHSVHLAIEAQRRLDKDLHKEASVVVIAPLETLLEQLCQRWSGGNLYIYK
jgi:hypothetical protein